jgi:hypothetical protein
MRKKLTVVITGHFLDSYLIYLKYLMYSLPETLKSCKFLIHYDNSENYNEVVEKSNLNEYLDGLGIDYEMTFGFGGLISSIDFLLGKIQTPYYIFLEHDWVFLENNHIDFTKVINGFDNHYFVNAVWFSKDDNAMRGFEICQDSSGKTTPFQKESRITECDLITTCRWSNNPVIFRTSKMKDWFRDYIKNEFVGKVNQRQGNVEESMISEYRKQISKNLWDNIKDQWGTYLYGNLGEGPFVGHTDASKRYQGHNKSEPEINGEEYMRRHPNV